MWWPACANQWSFIFSLSKKRVDLWALIRIWTASQAPNKRDIYQIHNPFTCTWHFNDNLSQMEDEHILTHHCYPYCEGKNSYTWSFSWQGLASSQTWQENCQFLLHSPWFQNNQSRIPYWTQFHLFSDGTYVEAVLLLVKIKVHSSINTLQSAENVIKDWGFKDNSFISFTGYSSEYGQHMRGIWYVKGV